VEREIIKKLQNRHAEAQTKVLDADVVTWLSMLGIYKNIAL
jgi:hypothetical protein